MLTKNSSFNVFYSDDLKTTEDFYKLIGAEIKKVQDDKLVIGVGEFDIHIILSSTEPSPDYKFMSMSHDKGGAAVFYIEVDNIDKLHQQIIFSGGTIKSGIYNNHWGAREFLCEDPNGYKFAFYQMI